jgi:hypothetical protein
MVPLMEHGRYEAADRIDVLEQPLQPMSERPAAGAHTKMSHRMAATIRITNKIVLNGGLGGVGGTGRTEMSHQSRMKRTTANNRSTRA